MKFGKKASNHLYTSCLRKLSYGSEAEAAGVLEDMIANPARPDWKPTQRLHVYPCDFSSHYHIGHVGRPPPLP